MSMTMADLANSLSKAAAQVDNNLSREVERIAEVGVGLVKRSIQDYHAVDTSTMLNSTTRQRQGKHAWDIGPTTDYAHFVAEGTRYMQARPFHRTAAKELEQRIQFINLAERVGLK